MKATKTIAKETAKGNKVEINITVTSYYDDCNHPHMMSEIVAAVDSKIVGRNFDTLACDRIGKLGVGDILRGEIKSAIAELENKILSDDIDFAKKYNDYNDTTTTRREKSYAEKYYDAEYKNEKECGN